MEIELPIEDPVLQFALLVTCSLVIRLSIEHVHLPRVIGLLVVGVLLGPGGLHVLPREPVVELLGSLGLVYVMFMAGLEIDLGTVRRHKQETVSFGLLAFLLSAVPAAVVGLVLGFDWPAALLFGSLLSSHTLLAYPIVQRLGLIHRRPVVAAVGGTLVTDTLALVVLAVVIRTGPEGGVLGWIGPLPLLAALCAVAVWLVPPGSRWMLRYCRTGGDKGMYVLVVLMVLAALTELIGTHKILGAFLAGVCLNREVSGQHVLREQMEFVGNLLFIPFFFVSTGMLLELEIFFSAWRVGLLAGLMVALVLAGKTAAAWLNGWWFGYRRNERGVMIGLTIPQAAATLAVTMTTHEAGLFDVEVVDAVIALIFVTCVAGPLLTRWAGFRLGREERTRAQQAGGDVSR